MADLSLFRSVESSNLPPAHKSALRRFADSMMTRHGGTYQRAAVHVKEGAHALRQGGESAITGGVLGAAHVYLPTGLDMKKVPLDLVLGVGGLVGGVAMANEGVGADLRNVGASAVTVFAFRKTTDFLAAKRRASGGIVGFAAKVAGEFGAEGQSDVGEDPIIATARLL